jgi:hypothetical protein
MTHTASGPRRTDGREQFVKAERGEERREDGGPDDGDRGGEGKREREGRRLDFPLPPPHISPLPLSLDRTPRSRARPTHTHTHTHHGRTRPRPRRRRAPAARPARPAGRPARPRLRLRPRGRTARRRPRRRPQRLPGGVQAARLRVVELLPGAGPADGDEARQVRAPEADASDEPLSHGGRGTAHLTLPRGPWALPLRLFLRHSSM